MQMLDTPLLHNSREYSSTGYVDNKFLYEAVAFLKKKLKTEQMNKNILTIH